MEKTLILVVDDEVSILKYLRINLEEDGYKIVTAINGLEAIQVFEKEIPALVILDIIMPEMDGFEVCKRIREWSHVPIIMLSARDSVLDKVTSLDSGADDYITKPFNANELKARVRAVLRRTKEAPTIPSQSALSSGDLNISFTKRLVTVAGEEIKLTPTEYNLLQELALNAGKVLTYLHLLNKIWGPEYREEKEYLHVFIRRLRSKLEPDASEPRYIDTMSGVGYRFRELDQVSNFPNTNN